MEMEVCDFHRFVGIKSAGTDGYLHTVHAYLRTASAIAIAHE